MSKTRGRAKLLIASIFLLALFGGGFWAYKTVSGASSGSVSVSTTEPDQPATVAERLTAEDDYAQFSYAANLSDTAVDSPVAPVLATHSLIKQQFAAWLLTVQVTRLPTGALSDSGTYNYRNNATTQFTKTQRKIGEQSVVVFSPKAAGPFNQTAYFQKDSLLASVALSGGTSQDIEAMQAELDTLIISWQWR